MTGMPKVVQDKNRTLEFSAGQMSDVRHYSRLACACRENEGNLRCSCSVWLPHLHVEQSVSFLQVACHSDLELPETKEVNTKS